MLSPSGRSMRAKFYVIILMTPKDSPDMTLKFFENGAWPGSRDPVNFGG